MVKYCKNCGKKLNSRQTKYCSNSCQREFEYKTYIEQWKNGEVNGLSGEYNISKNIRKYLFAKYENKCSQCGWGEINTFTNTIPLEIHHKDGNYLNNSEDNLQLLCPNCHSLTGFHKSHNKNGRSKRTKYYKKIKS